MSTEISTTVLIALDQIRIDGGTQARAGLDEPTVAEYATTWQDLSYQPNGLDRMPPIVVYHDGASYWLADGFHRVEAYKRFLRDGKPSASPHTIQAEIKQGTRRDAVLYACGANAAHGLRRTTADKRRAVETLLRDEEWRQWSDRKIADACAVDHKTVAGVRADLVAGGEIPHLAERQGSDGKVYAAAPARPITPESRDADGPWFWATKSAVHPTAHCWHVSRLTGKWVSACGLEVPVQPIHGARGFHCGVCETNAERREIVPIPGAPAPEHPPMPGDLRDAGYRWRKPAAGELAISNLDGWQGDAPTVDGMLQLARDRMAARAAKDTPPDDSPAFDPARVAAIRSYLDAQGVRGRVYNRETFDHAFDLAHDIHDGDTYRSITQEIHDRTNSGNGAPKAAPAPAPRVAIDWNEIASLSYALGAEHDQQAAWEIWQRIGHALVLSDARMFAINLLRMLAPLIAQSRASDLENLSQAISDLNECQEGTEAEHWVRVGWALLDLEAEAAVGVPTLESEGIA